MAHRRPPFDGRSAICDTWRTGGRRLMVTVPYVKREARRSPSRFCVNPAMVQPSIGLKKEPANSINKRLDVELLQEIFTWLWFPWSYAHVGQRWRFWDHDGTFVSGEQWSIVLADLFDSFDIWSFGNVAAISNTWMLELGHWVDFWDEADDTMEPPTADNLTGYLSQSLVDLRLIFLTPGAIRHFSLWFASHASADRTSPPVKKLQSRSGHHTEVLFYMSPLLLAISSTLTELHIEILAGRDVAVETTDIITLRCLQKFSVKCLESMLQPLFFLIRWDGILDSLTITAASTEWHWGCLIDHEPFVAIFPFTQLSPSTTRHLLLICPCRRYHHAKHIVEKLTCFPRYAFCAFKVTFAGEDKKCVDDNDCDSGDKALEMVQDTDSDSGSSDGTAPDLEDYKGANVSWTWLPCWDDMPYWHKARAEQALLTGQLQDARWNCGSSVIGVCIMVQWAVIGRLLLKSPGWMVSSVTTRANTRALDAQGACNPEESLIVPDVDKNSALNNEKPMLKRLANLAARQKAAREGMRALRAARKKLSIAEQSAFRSEQRGHEESYRSKNRDALRYKADERRTTEYLQTHSYGEWCMKETRRGHLHHPDEYSSRDTGPELYRRRFDPKTGQGTRSRPK
ncbi:hypothetical protein C8J56DRAFT_887161 [Mycena floridula]|nr:hypothetical protein C8J56DRAFT_887161 [Mycena floridula]